MTSRPAASSRDNNFNLIRFMAALCVMIGHMSFIAPGPLYIFLGNGIQIMGVRTIFLLGGYLISKSWSSDPHVLRYAVKRAFRIWPALIVFTLGVTLVAGPILSVLPAGEYFRNPATWQYLGAIGFYISYGLPGVFADVPYAGVVNGSLWTMPLEVALYVLVPLVLWLVSRRPWRKHASLLTAIFVGLYVVAAVLRCAVFPQWRMVIYGLDVAQFLVLGVYYMLGMLYALPQVRRFLNLQVASLLLVAAAMAQFTMRPTKCATCWCSRISCFPWACAKSRCSRALGERRSFPTAFTCTAFSCSSAWCGCAAAWAGRCPTGGCRW